MSHSGLGFPGLVRSPLVRANVTRLDKTAPPGLPREDRRPFRVLPFPAKDHLDAGSPLLGMKSLGEDICKLLQGVDSNQEQVSILDSFMGFRMSMCLARSRPPIMLLLHSIQTLLSLPV
jgi:hypothetical protein